jgi:hypothetical protein
MTSRSVVLAWAAIACATVWGCGSHTEWKIDVHNQGTAPCSVRVEMDSVNRSGRGTSEAHVDKMNAGERLTLISGTLATTIRSIKVVRGEEEQALTPAVTIQPGQRYLIAVPAAGPVNVALDTNK